MGAEVDLSRAAVELASRRPLCNLPSRCWPIIARGRGGPASLVQPHPAAYPEAAMRCRLYAPAWDDVSRPHHMAES